MVVLPAIGVTPLTTSDVASIRSRRMGNPMMGAIVVAFAVLSLVTMDSLGGLARLFGLFTGATYPNWADSVAELHASFPLPTTTEDLKPIKP